MTKVYSFAKQRGLGKWGEKQVMAHLKAIPETIDVIDVADKPELYKHGIDFLWLKRAGADVETVKLDVKMDMLLHRTGNVFIETMSSENKRGNAMTSDADYFCYYDPYGKTLYFYEVKLLKSYIEENYDSLCSQGKHKKVQNKGYQSEGFAIAPDLLTGAGIGYKQAMLVDCDEEVCYTV